MQCETGLRLLCKTADDTYEHRYKCGTKKKTCLKQVFFREFLVDGAGFEPATPAV